MFLSGFGEKKFLQIFVVCFRVHPWYVNEYTVRVLITAAIRHKYEKLICFICWTVRVIFILESFHTEMHCILSDVLFIPKTK